MTEKRVNGNIGNLSPEDVIAGELQAEIQRVSESFAFEVDYSEPEVEVTSGAVILAFGNDITEVAPRGSIELAESSVNHLYAGYHQSTPTLYADTTAAGPQWNAVKIGTVDTSNDTESPVAARDTPHASTKSLDTEDLGIKEQSSAPSGESGQQKLYAADDGTIYRVAPDGTTEAIGSGGGGGSTVEDSLVNNGGWAPGLNGQ